LVRAAFAQVAANSFSSVTQMMSESRLVAYIKALSRHLWWYLTCGPLAVEELFDPVLRVYGIDLDRYIARGHVTLLLVLFAFVGVFCSGYLTWRDADDGRVLVENQLEELTRPRFIPEITKLAVEGVHARSDLINLYVFMTFVT
jgi:membrane protein required for beta-lactamase induction